MSEDSGSVLTENKHAQLAYTYVNQAWFPIDAAVLERIQDNLYQGIYESDKGKLLADLRQDYSLFLYCLRQLTEILSNASPENEKLSPADVFERATLVHFRDALAVHPTAVSTHHDDETASDHIDCCLRAVASATAAESLASAESVARDDAFSCALLRQLGITLIAWNYPHVYRRVIASLPPGESPDEMLGRMLGFTPRLLALTVAHRWKLSDNVLLAIDPSFTQSSPDPAARRSGEILAKICELGEAFAQNLDEGANSKSGLWQEALNEITSRLGTSGIEKLRAAVQVNLSSFARRYPSALDWSRPAPQGETSSTLKTATLSSLELFEQNLYIRRCSTVEQAEFRALYEACTPGSLSKEPLEILKRRVIPSLGFERGCIFLIEPDSMNLLPRLPLGNASLLDYRPLRFSSTQSAFDPIVAAFSSKTPTIEEKEVPGVGRVMYIACSLGDLQRIGVLYLELGHEQIARRRGTNPLVAFKAVRQALSDILTIR